MTRFASARSVRRSVRLAPVLGLLTALLLPSSSSALNFPVAWTTDNTLGVNNVALTVRLVCSGLLCSFVGFGSPYQQTQTSNLTGTGAGTLDDVTDDIQLNMFLGTGSDVAFTSIPVFGTVNVTDVVVQMITAATGTIAGFDLPQNGQSIATTLTGGQWSATATTDNTTIPTIAIGPISISSPGTFVELGPDGFGNPQFALQNLRGAFDFLTATSISGVTIRSTFRATFTLNLRGVGTVPEPGTFALIAGGLALFAGTAARRRKS